MAEEQANQVRCCGRERQEREIKKQIKPTEQMMPALANGSGEKPELCPSQSEPTGKIDFSLGSSLKLVAAENPKSSKPAFEELEAEVTTNKHESSTSGMKVSSALDKLMKEQEMAKERSNWKDYWHCEGIIVRVMSRGLADMGYYKQQGLVIEVIDEYVREIEMLDSKHMLRIDQEELETVIPQIGGLVRIVNGAYRRSNARLLSVYTDNYCAKEKVAKGVHDGRVLQAVDYEDICKINELLEVQLPSNSSNQEIGGNLFQVSSINFSARASFPLEIFLVSFSTQPIDCQWQHHTIRPLPLCISILIFSLKKIVR